MNRNYILVGAGGHGQVVKEVIESRNDHVIGFLDYNAAKYKTKIDGVTVWGSIEDSEALYKQYECDFIVAIGDNYIRHEYSKLLKFWRLPLGQAIHSTAVISPSAEIGENVVICAGVIVSAHVVVGNDVILNTGSIVDHESVIGDGAHICPGVNLAGHIIIGERSFVGIGSSIIQNLDIGDRAIIGAGSVVLQNIPASVLAFGVPAKIIKKIYTPNYKIDNNL